VEQATAARPAALPDLIRFGLIVALLVLAALAWALTDQRMAGMDAGPNTDPGELGFFITVWVVMMAAMMFPSIAPMVIMYARIQEGKRERGDEVQAGTTAIFIAGYLVTWGAVGLVGYAIASLVGSLDIDALSWDRGGPYIAGGVIFAAGLYQLTPLKDACLRRCRSPLMFLLNSWQPGRAGGLRMGIEHGAWCVGCCWMLMAALFALGVMSIGWMAFIAALIAIEKLLPWKAVANRGIAVMLLVLGLVVAFVPDDVPGLVQPDSAEAQQAMQSMGMDDGSMEGQAMPGGGSGEGSMDDESMPGAGNGGGSMDDSSMPGAGKGGGGSMDDSMP
jgi:predicted metal-binding membrane protein